MRRTRSSYRMVEYGMPESNGVPGNYIIRKDRGELTKLAWEDANSVTVARLMPPKGYEEDDGDWGPARYSENPGDIGDYIRGYVMARSVGQQNPVSFILFNPETDPNYDIADNPVMLIWRNLVNAIKNGRERSGWARLKEGAQGKGAAIKRPKKSYLTQAAILRKGNQKPFRVPKGCDPGDLIPVLDLGPSAGEALLRCIDERREGADPETDDINKLFVVGDPVSFKKNCGRYFNFFRLGQDPRHPADSDDEYQIARPGQSRRDAGGGHDDDVATGYGVFAEKKYKGMFASWVEWEPILRPKVQYWDDLLLFMSDEEQAKLLASGGRFPFDLIQMAFADHPEWIPDRDSDEAREGRSAVSGRSGWKDDGDEDRDEDQPVRRGRSTHVADEEEDEEEEKAPKTRRTKDVATPKHSIPDEDEEDEEESPPKKSSKKKTVEPEEDEDEGEDEEPPKKRSKKKAEPEDEDEEDEPPVRRTRKPAAAEPDEDEDEDDEPVAKTTRKTRSAPPAEDDEDEEDDVAATKRQSRRVRGK